MHELHDVFIGIGTNVGNRLENLGFAVQRLRSLFDEMECSPVYETEPVGVLEQPKFLNMVVKMRVTLSPMQLLEQLMQVENEGGRVRTIRFGPRTLDLDILLYDDSYYCFKNLQIPHPRMWERSFVIAPLAALVPERRCLGGYTMKELSFRLRQEGDVQHVGRFW